MTMPPSLVPGKPHNIDFINFNMNTLAVFVYQFVLCYLIQYDKYLESIIKCISRCLACDVLCIRSITSYNIE